MTTIVVVQTYQPFHPHDVVQLLRPESRASTKTVAENGETEAPCPHMPSSASAISSG